MNIHTTIQSALVFVGLVLVIAILCSNSHARSTLQSELEVINRESSHQKTEAKARYALKHLQGIGSLSDKILLDFCVKIYGKHLSSRSEGDYLGILDLISAGMLSEVIETAMLKRNFRKEYLLHASYLVRTLGYDFKSPKALFLNLQRYVTDPCEQVGWNAILISKSVSSHYRFNVGSQCKEIDLKFKRKSSYTYNELNAIVYKARVYSKRPCGETRSCH